MSNTYYPYAFRLNGRRLCLLWGAGHGKDPDDVVLDDEGRLPVFETPDAASVYASRRGLGFVDKDCVEPIDLDALTEWLARPTDKIDCPTLLNAWNIFGDVATALNGVRTHIDERQHGHLYDKLFFGLNLPAVTPEGQHYEPGWSDEEVGILVDLLGPWLIKFRRLIQPVVIK